MYDERDAMKLVKAELCERLARMQNFSKRTSQNTFAESIGAFRTMAAAYGLEPVVRLVDALERGLADGGMRSGRTYPVALYLDRLQDAIGCDRIDDHTSEAMIASVSVRLSA
jgi:hypothetical protein